jgi:hypothetical protein
MQAAKEQKGQYTRSSRPACHHQSLRKLRVRELLYLSNKMMCPKSIESLVGAWIQKSLYFGFGEGFGAATDIETFEIETEDINGDV